MTDIEKAKNILCDENNNYTCVLVFNDKIETTVKRGVKPLLEAYESGRDYSEYSAADRVVGKGAAFLYILLKIKTVYAKTVSKPALDLLEKNGVKIEYEILTDNIINRTKTGICPFEEATMDISDPVLALKAIKETMSKMTNRN